MMMEIKIGESKKNGKIIFLSDVIYKYLDNLKCLAGLKGCTGNVQQERRRMLMNPEALLKIWRILHPRSSMMTIDLWLRDL